MKNIYYLNKENRERNNINLIDKLILLHLKS